MSILVTGGAGYIGSHTTMKLLAENEEVVVVDNLQTGHRQAVPEVPFYQVDIRDSSEIETIIKRHKVEAVIHFAANSLVGESVLNPLKYFQNNFSATTSFIHTLVKNKVDKIVFSSTAAVYGEPSRCPIEEDDEKHPTNPYGESKLMIERMLRWCHEAYQLRSASLRYFNAAGAHPDLPMGEDHHPETHLIPLVMQVALNQLEYISVFGNDYPTIDGTCIRDYIHVMDLADVHYLALQYLRSNCVAEAFNLGNGQGFSVKEVIEAARRVTGCAIPAKDANRRPGDPAVLVASSKKARDILGFSPKYTSIEQIIETAWAWHKQHPNGFADDEKLQNAL